MGKPDEFSNEQMQIALEALVERSKEMIMELVSLRAAAQRVVQNWEMSLSLDEAIKELRRELETGKDRASNADDSMCDTSFFDQLPN